LNFKDSNIVFCDKDTLLHQKKIEGYSIEPYEYISVYKPDLILVLPPLQHRLDILNQVLKNCANSENILLSEVDGNDNSVF
jgi:hypothetical protein